MWNKTFNQAKQNTLRFLHSTLPRRQFALIYKKGTNIVSKSVFEAKIAMQTLEKQK